MVVLEVLQILSLYSCEYFEFLQDNMSQRIQIDEIFTDYSKGFIVVIHDILLLKLLQTAFVLYNKPHI